MCRAKTRIVVCIVEIRCGKFCAAELCNSIIHKFKAGYRNHRIKLSVVSAYAQLEALELPFSTERVKQKQYYIPGEILMISANSKDSKNAGW